MPRDPKKSKPPQKGGMSIYPPFRVAAALGGYRTVTLTLGVRLAAQVLGEAAVDVAGRFSPAEWSVLAASLDGRVIDPEIPMPAHVMADLVRWARQLYGVADHVGVAADEYQDVVVNGPNGPIRFGTSVPDEFPGEAPPDLPNRLRALSYAQAWAVLIACRFHEEYRADIGEGDRWWEMPYRAAKIRPAQQEAAR